MTLTYKVTRDSCCVELYVVDIPDPKNLQNIKDHRSSTTRTRDKRGHVHGHVPLRHMVTLEGYNVDLCPFELFKQDPYEIAQKSYM